MSGLKIDIYKLLFLCYKEEKKEVIMLFITFDELATETSINEDLLKELVDDDFIAKNKWGETFVVFSSAMISRLSKVYFAKTKKDDKYENLNTVYKMLTAFGDNYWKGDLKKVKKQIHALPRPNYRDMYYKHQQELAKKADQLVKEHRTKQYYKDLQKVSSEKPLFVANFKTKTVGEWSRSAVDCLNIKGRCQICLLSKITEHECVMKRTVAKLLDKFGMPDGAEITKDEANLIFSRYLC